MQTKKNMIKAKELKTDFLNNVCFIAGAHHIVDSNEISFIMAAVGAIKQCKFESKVKLLIILYTTLKIYLLVITSIVMNFFFNVSSHCGTFCEFFYRYNCTCI